MSKVAVVKYVVNKQSVRAVAEELVEVLDRTNGETYEVVLYTDDADLTEKQRDEEWVRGLRGPRVGTREYKAMWPRSGK